MVATKVVKRVVSKAVQKAAEWVDERAAWSEASMVEKSAAL